MKKLVVLGSTGSVGRQTLEVVSAFPEKFRVLALTAASNWKLLVEQARKFHPQAVVILKSEYYPLVREALPKEVEVFSGEEALCEVASWPEAELVVSAIVGMAGLRPTLSALSVGKTVALANKEALVVGGDLIRRVRLKTGARILPVDSEHSALFQVLKGHRRREVSRLILTASGGPFLRTPKERFSEITPEEALKHPRWHMGAKITVDSATLMNKGLEVIEAHQLFGVPYRRIEVVIHPESIVHSLVEFRDGSTLAQMSLPDMRLPIAYALSYPERLPLPYPRLNLSEVGRLTFEAPDFEKFPCLRMAYEAGEKGGFFPVVLNAANEETVAAFLSGSIRFDHIPQVIEETLNRFSFSGKPGSLEEILRADDQARRKARQIIKEMK
ncbi:1-deoxy-D-xylulose-5-phosphate reductoisomerase [Thermosulfurimonas dismutans]|uniref:1-deoxy-D-xylulose 5-phosphate reductoisomerase n=1 Tax=Thermosulfurimonas dismutans TaxID=999894 RepID=A0A179D513_9BACT|nr:1-deoxy-D-xylulose-5-phosphate reductoisomerase [Thermosulfurimonas dismutans]OAQ21147.1 1-deoxy-D-xylulose 5-phosphate reductoisomerase [Thermosulfurimonas dismutans]